MPYICSARLLEHTLGQTALLLPGSSLEGVEVVAAGGGLECMRFIWKLLLHGTPRGAGLRRSRVLVQLSSFLCCEMADLF
jgi:hypothetical protein